MTSSTRHFDPHGPDPLSWTALGQRMGFTSEHAQRAEILAAIDRMNWVQTPTRPPCLDSSVVRDVVRAVVMAVFHHRRDQLRSIVGVGRAQLSGGRWLIGLEDTLGTRSYVLDLDAEAIYVLAEFSRPLARAGRRTNPAGDPACDYGVDTAHVA